MASLNEFKTELRGRLIDFATSYQLVHGGEVKTQKQKDEWTDKGYEKLERWILEQFNTWLIDGPKKVPLEPEVNPEDTTISLDF